MMRKPNGRNQNKAKEIKHRSSILIEIETLKGMKMKIAVKDIEANPYRKMERYPVSRTEIDHLKAKIKRTFFWDNLIARPCPDNNGKFQIAYGHRRLMALRELKIKEIDIPVKELSDDDMLHIMADENHHLMPNPAIMNETVLAIKEYLDGELAKHDTWEQAQKVQYLLNLFSDDKNPKATFGQAKGSQGVGETLLLRFLGPEWARSIVRIGLNIVKTSPKVLDRKQVERMPSIRKAERFAQAVKLRKIPLNKQKNFADKILKEDTSAEAMSSVAMEFTSQPKEFITKPVDDFVKIKRTIEDIEAGANALRRKIQGLRAELRRLDVIELKGLKTFLAMVALKSLIKECGQIEGRK